MGFRISGLGFRVVRDLGLGAQIVANKLKVKQTRRWSVE